ncbi:unnamed protein product [Protopolystoma xenopodis]|uniref:Uncharacterized protein n=1 Tax=Protopolystoma xenopodis TaxID=117903 RepID=A0A448WV45_9PLAT|nr:unnamed protein product [Protopolystoma xenopodis]
MDNLGALLSLDELKEALQLLDGVPVVLIATNVPKSVYSDPISKAEFENVFKCFDASSTFIYLPSFCRAQLI